MSKTLALLALVLLPLSAIADETTKPNAPATPPTVSVSSKGNDVRVVLHDLFTQVGKSFVVEPNLRFPLYLNLDNFEFEEALQVVCTTAGFKYQVQNGIYYISKADAPKTAVKPTPAPPKVEEPKGKLPESVLQKRITTRSTKADLRGIFAEFTKQTGVKFEIDANIPGYKLDAFLINTSLKYALDQITGAAKLKYKFTEKQTIEISRLEPENKVTLIVE